MSPRVIAVVGADDGGDLRSVREPAHIPEVSSVVAVSGGPGGSQEALERAIADGADWVWLLDSRDEPEPDALSRLLDIAGSGEAVGLVGPSLRVSDSERLASAGVTTTAQGLRVNPVSPGEVDQGQFERTEDVYAVDLPGALVSAAAVRAVGAPAASLPTSYRGIDYSRRVRAAGFRVVLAPRADVVIAATTARALVSSPRPPRAVADLRAEHRFRLARVRPSAAWRTALFLWCAAILSAGASLLANDPRGAGRWLGAAGALSKDRRAVASLRRTAPTAEPAPGLLASRRRLETARRELRETGADGTAAWWDRPASGSALLEEDSSAHSAEEALNTGEELQSFSRIDVGPRRSVLLHPLTAVLTLTSVAAVLINWRLFGPGTVAGGAMPRLDVSFAEAWERVFSLHDAGGLGAQAPADSLLTVLLVWSLPFLGDIDLAVRVLFVIALPVAALLVYLSAGRFTKRPSIRALLALVWAASPAFVLSLVEGRIGTVVAWVVLPVVVRALHSALTRHSVEASAAAGLLLAVVCAAMPIMLVPAVGLIAVLVVRTHAWRLVWAVVPVFALTGPWLLGAVRHPDALLADPGEVFPFPVARSWILALGWPEVPVFQAVAGTPAAAYIGLILLVSVPLLIAAGAAYFRRDAPDGLIVGSTVLTVVGLCLGIAQSMTAVGLTAHRLVAAWPGAGLALFTLGICGLLAASLVRAPSRRGHAALPAPRRARAIVVAAAASAALIVSAIALDAGVGGAEVQRTGNDRLPVFAGERANGPLAQRTLILDVTDGEVIGQLAGATGGTVLDSSTLTQAEEIRGFGPRRVPVGLDPADTAFAEAVGRLTSDTGGDAGRALAALGVGFVVLTGDDDENLDDATRSVSAATGLTRLGTAEQGLLWQVDPDSSVEGPQDDQSAEEPTGSSEVAWARIVESGGATVPVPVVDGVVEVPAGEAGRRLILAERDGVMSAAATHADEDDHTLPAGDAADGWAQSYLLPAEATTVTLSATPGWYRWAVSAGGLLLLVTIVVSVPIGRKVRR